MIFLTCSDYKKYKRTILTCLCAAAQARGVKPVLSTVLTSVPTEKKNIILQNIDLVMFETQTLAHSQSKAPDPLPFEISVENTPLQLCGLSVEIIVRIMTNLL